MRLRVLFRFALIAGLVVAPQPALAQYTYVGPGDLKGSSIYLDTASLARTDRLGHFAAFVTISLKPTQGGGKVGGVESAIIVNGCSNGQGSIFAVPPTPDGDVLKKDWSAAGLRPYDAIAKAMCNEARRHGWRE